jgi:hypothetical protein
VVLPVGVSRKLLQGWGSRPNRASLLFTLTVPRWAKANPSVPVDSVDGQLSLSQEDELKFII